MGRIWKKLIDFFLAPVPMTGGLRPWTIIKSNQRAMRLMLYVIVKLILGAQHATQHRTHMYYTHFVLRIYELLLREMYYVVPRGPSGSAWFPLPPQPKKTPQQQQKNRSFCHQSVMVVRKPGPLPPTPMTHARQAWLFAYVRVPSTRKTNRFSFRRRSFVSTHTCTCSHRSAVHCWCKRVIGKRGCAREGGSVGWGVGVVG